MSLSRQSRRTRPSSGETQTAAPRKSARRKFLGSRPSPVRPRVLQMESLEDRSLLAAILYVDNTPGSGGTEFTASGGTQPASVPGLVPGTSIFPTISAAVAFATAGDTINVSDGAYVENIPDPTTVILRGNQFGVDARTRVAASETRVAPAVAATNTLTISHGGAGMVVDGFQFVGGTSLGVIQTTVGPNNNMQIINNQFSGYSQAATFLNRGGADITIDKNVMDGSGIAGGTNQQIFLNGPQFFNGIFITNNNIINAPNRYGIFVDGNHNVGESATRAPKISGNIFDSDLQGMNLGSRSFGTLAAPVLGPFGGEISNNRFSSNAFDGIQGGIQHVLVTRNAFTNNGRTGVTLTSFGNVGVDRGAQFSVISENFFSGNVSEDVFFSASQAPGTIGTNQVFGNSLGSAVAVTYTGAETPNASRNWWGTNTDAGVTAKIGGAGAANVDRTPFLNVGTDTDLVTTGFQGDFSTVIVTPTGGQNGATGRINEGVGAVTGGGTVKILPGAYAEIVNTSGNNVHLSPGASPGQITVNGLVLDGNDFLDIELNGTSPSAPTQFDNIIVNGGVTLGGATLNGTLGFFPPGGTSFKIIDNDTAIDPVIGAFAQGGAVVISGVPFTINYAGGDGNDVVLTVVTPVVTYADDSWVGLVNGTPIVDADDVAPGNQPATIGYDAFATIQAAVNAVAATGTTIVNIGTYAEHVTIGKTVVLLGHNRGINPVTTPRGPESIVDGTLTDAAFIVQADNVVIDGFKVVNGANGGFNSGIWTTNTDSGYDIVNNILTGNSIGVYANSDGPSQVRFNLFDANNAPGPSGGAGIYSDQASLGLRIIGNELKNHTVNNPILLVGSAINTHQGLLVADNNLHDNLFGIFTIALNGAFFQGNEVKTTPPATALTIGDGSTDVHVTNNKLSGNLRSLRIQDFGFFGASPLSNVTVNFNDLSGSTGTENLLVPAGSYTGNLDASANYWASANPATVALKINAPDNNVDFTPLLNNNESVPNQAILGFQPDLSLVTVHTLGQQVGPDGRIQEGINVVDNNGTVAILGGTYAGNVDAVTLIKNVNLSPGASPAQVIVNGNFSINGGDTLTMELNGLNPLTQYDNFVVNGTVSLGTGPADFATLSATAGFVYPNLSIITLIDNDGTLDPTAGQFLGFPDGSSITISGQQFIVFYNGGDGNNVILVKASPFPPTITYAEDVSWNALAPGATVDGDRSTAAVESAVIGVNAFGPLTPAPGVGAINKAIIAAAAGATVIVNDGNYPENVVINKNLTLDGQPGDVLGGPVTGAATITGAGVGITVMSANAVTIKDISVASGGNALDVDLNPNATLVLDKVTTTTPGTIDIVGTVNVLLDDGVNTVNVNGNSFSANNIAPVAYTAVTNLSINTRGANDTINATPAPLGGTNIKIIGGLPNPPGTPVPFPNGVPNGNTPGDTLNLDMTAAADPVIVSTVSGLATSASTQPLTFQEIETINVTDGVLLPIQMGDLYVTGTNGPDTIQVMLNSAQVPGQPTNIRLRVNSSFFNVQATTKVIVHGLDGNDNIQDPNVVLPMEFYGETGDDYLAGGVANDLLVGGSGNDRVLGGNGDNTLYGDNIGTEGNSDFPDGNDQVIGGTGNDIMYGGGGSDTVTGQGGNDVEYGEAGNDLMDGGDGDDRLYGGDGNDTIGGAAGNDFIAGNAGNDKLYGKSGNDVVVGGDGADLVMGDDGNDLLFDGTITYNSPAPPVVGNDSSTTANDTNDQAMLALLNAWKTNTLNAANVTRIHDAFVDTLGGGIGTDTASPGPGDNGDWEILLP